MKPDEERAVLERAAKVCIECGPYKWPNEADRHVANTIAAAIRALPLTTESAATQENSLPEASIPQADDSQKCEPATGDVSGIAPPVSAADHPIPKCLFCCHTPDDCKWGGSKGCDAYCGNPSHDPLSAPAQSSTASLQVAPSQEGVGQGEIAQGAAHVPTDAEAIEAEQLSEAAAAPLEPALLPCPFCGVSLMLSTGPKRRTTDVSFEVYQHPSNGCYLSSFQLCQDDSAKWNKRAIPPGYAVVPVEPTEEMIDVVFRGYSWPMEFGIDHQQRSRQEAIRTYQTMIAYAPSVGKEGT